jgi:2-(1,2-epoxy-1,2-dihydrophenyl)acetyl-CoA isomerase
MIDAPAAKACGLVTSVVDPEKLQEETLAFARRFAEGPRFALGLIKQNLVAAETATLKEMIELEAYHHAKTGETEEHVEAVAAFRERRKPKFK